MQTSPAPAQGYALAAGVLGGTSLTLSVLLLQHCCLHLLPGRNPYGIVNLGEEEEEEGTTG